MCSVQSFRFPNRRGGGYVTVVMKKPPRKGRKKNRNVSRDLALVEKVAQLTFYHQGRPSWRGANEVAKDLRAQGYDVTVNAVIACQKKARDRGIISIIYNRTYEQADILRL